jgi:hypothetical protein
MFGAVPLRVLPQGWLLSCGNTGSDPVPAYSQHTRHSSWLEELAGPFHLPAACMLGAENFHITCVACVHSIACRCRGPCWLAFLLELKQQLLLLLIVSLTGCTMALVAEQHAELQLFLLCWPSFLWLLPHAVSHTPSRVSGTCLVGGAWTVSGLALPASSLLQPSAVMLMLHSSSANTDSPTMLKQTRNQLLQFVI